MHTRTSALFASPGADLVLRTSDAVALRVSAALLADASPFFADLLSLPQPPPAAPSAACAPAPPTAPVVDISEPAEVMEPLLSFVYPRPDPPVETLDALAPLLAAALKYDFTSAAAALRSLLVSPAFLAKEPTRVYALACMHALGAEAALASAHTLTQGRDLLAGPLPTELRYVTALEYHALLALHRARREGACALLVRAEEVKCANCTAVMYGKPCVPKWWEDWAGRAREELMRCPVSETIFSLPFLSQSANAGCPRCGTSLLASHEFLMQLKAAIDALPSTV